MTPSILMAFFGKINLLGVIAFGACLAKACCGGVAITSIDRQGNLTWTGAFSNGVCTVESLPVLNNGGSGQWQFEGSFFSTNSAGRGKAALASNNGFFRVMALDVSAATPNGYTNFIHSFGELETIAGNGTGGTDGVNYWKTSYEGGLAVNAALSRPHNALADAAGNVYIVDKGSHSILKVTPDGRIHTVAGTHTGGFNGDGPAPATKLDLYQPNGLYIRADGMIYILDTGNGKVRRLDTNGMMSTLFTYSGGIDTGRGLWVDDAEASVLFCDKNNLRMWTPNGGVAVLNSSFTELGNILVNNKSYVIATDRGDNSVWTVPISGKNMGKRTRLFGDGGISAFVDGTLAASGSLYGVRGVWCPPTGGYLLALHEGSQIIYVDTAGIGHVFVNGMDNAHSGDGDWFHLPGYKISQARSVSMDPRGNILIVESDYGFVRRIAFKPYNF